MADFKITGAVGLNGTVYRAGSEDALQSAAEKAGIDLTGERFSGSIEQAAGGGDPYADMNKAALQAEADKRGLEVKGTGSGGNVLADDLRAALRASDGA